MGKELTEIDVKVMEAYPVTQREAEGCIVEFIENQNKRALLRKRLINELRAGKQEV
jgi:hypothetical protein